MPTKRFSRSSLTTRTSRRLLPTSIAGRSTTACARRRKLRVVSPPGHARQQPMRHVKLLPKDVCGALQQAAEQAAAIPTLEAASGAVSEIPWNVSKSPKLVRWAGPESAGVPIEVRHLAEHL